MEKWRNTFKYLIRIKAEFYSLPVMIGKECLNFLNKT